MVLVLFFPSGIVPGVGYSVLNSLEKVSKSHSFSNLCKRLEEERVQVKSCKQLSYSLQPVCVLNKTIPSCVFWQPIKEAASALVHTAVCLRVKSLRIYFRSKSLPSEYSATDLSFVII